MSHNIFALDIGTQSVTGILLERNDHQFRVIDYHTELHQERSMLDGQIQHVIQVSEVIQKVKHTLEEKHGPLQEVCVAAAGRALKTVQTKKIQSISNKPLTTEEEINHFTLSAVQQAQLELVQDDTTSFADYHCVGFSVLHYYLDGEKIVSLIDQTGEIASVEVITTFLPRVVIESLLAALDRAHLKMRALTLEPIAAIHVLVPSSMRRLNVALIDIGAGTSDIAISKEGTVTAYGMVPVAGDEITESISDTYLLDFKEAEKAKQTIVNEQTTTVHDILGFEQEITYDALTSGIADRTQHLAQLLGEELLQLNAKVPQAVMLIGGGSMTPNIAENLASYLNLPKNRVAIRGVEAISFLDQANLKTLPSGPDFVTPIGIAISATDNPLHYTNLYVNDTLILMFQTKTLTVGDCLVQAGIDIHKCYGKLGLSRIAEVNGETLTLRGKYGETPVLTLNGEPTSVSQSIQAEDRIFITKGTDGKEPQIAIRDIIDKQQETRQYYYGGKLQTIDTYCEVNGHQATLDDIIQDKDRINIHTPETIQEVLQTLHPEALVSENPFEITLNHQPVQLKKGKQQFFLNEKEVTLSSIIHNGDSLTSKQPSPVTVETMLVQLDKTLRHEIKVVFNDTPVILMQEQNKVYRDGESLAPSSHIHHNDRLTLTAQPLKHFIFQDIFRYVDIQPANKGTYTLTINDSPASFHDTIHDGDQLQLIWDKEA